MYYLYIVSFLISDLLFPKPDFASESLTESLNTNSWTRPHACKKTLFLKAKTKNRQANFKSSETWALDLCKRPLFPNTIETSLTSRSFSCIVLLWCPLISYSALFPLDITI